MKKDSKRETQTSKKTVKYKLFNKIEILKKHLNGNAKSGSKKPK